MKTARPGPCESHGQVLQNGTGRRLGPAGRWIVYHQGLLLWGIGGPIGPRSHCPVSEALQSSSTRSERLRCPSMPSPSPGPQLASTQTTTWAVCLE